MAKFITRPGVLAALSLGAGAVHQAAKDQEEQEKYQLDFAKMDYAQRQKRLDEAITAGRDRTQARIGVLTGAVNDYTQPGAMAPAAAGLGDLGVLTPEEVAGIQGNATQIQARLDAKQQADEVARQEKERADRFTMEAKIRDEIRTSASPVDAFNDLRSRPEIASFVPNTPEFLAWVQSEAARAKREASASDQKKQEDLNELSRGAEILAILSVDPQTGKPQGDIPAAYRKVQEFWSKKQNVPGEVLKLLESLIQENQTISNNAMWNPGAGNTNRFGAVPPAVEAQQAEIRRREEKRAEEARLKLEGQGGGTTTAPAETTQSAQAAAPADTSLTPEMAAQLSGGGSILPNAATSPQAAAPDSLELPQPPPVQPPPAPKKTATAADSTGQPITVGPTTYQLIEKIVKEKHKTPEQAIEYVRGLEQAGKWNMKD